MEPMSNPLEPEALKLVNRALEVLTDKVKHDKCPRCDVFDWSVDPIAINVIPIQGIPAHMPHAYFPGRILLIQIVCKNCGYTMFHNLNVLGLAVPEAR
jgi:predicted nucleic-acid-binding Zn-ribbon protein